MFGVVIASAATGNIGNLNSPVTLGAAAALGTCVLMAGTSICIVGTGDQALVERLGKFNRVLEPGLNLLIPFVESISAYASVREQVYYSVEPSLVYGFLLFENPLLTMHFVEMLTSNVS